jgi:hypothetical protein
VSSPWHALVGCINSLGRPSAEHDDTTIPLAPDDAGYGWWSDYRSGPYSVHKVAFSVCDTCELLYTTQVVVFELMYHNSDQRVPTRQLVCSRPVNRQSICCRLLLSHFSVGSEGGLACRLAEHPSHIGRVAWIGSDCRIIVRRSELITAWCRPSHR